MPIFKKMAGIALSGILLSFSLTANDADEWEAKTEYQGNIATMRTNSKRCLASILYTLWKNYQWSLTFEEVPLEYAHDLQDVTSSSYRPTSPPYRILVPRGGPLEFTFEISEQTKQPVSQDETIARLLTAYQEARLPGEYRVEKSNSVLHIVPYKTLNQAGQSTPVVPIMDARISLPERADRRNGATLRAVVDEIQLQTGKRVVIGTALKADFENALFTKAISSLKAREMLEAEFHAAGEHGLWLLLYDPTFEQYVLSIF